MNELQIDLVAIKARMDAAVDNPNLEVKQCVELFPAFLAVIDEATKLRSDISVAEKRIGELEKDKARLDWLIKQGPPGATEAFGLNEELWEHACCCVQDDDLKANTDQIVVRRAIDEYMADQSTPPQQGSE